MGGVINTMINEILPTAGRGANFSLVQTFGLVSLALGPLCAGSFPAIAFATYSAIFALGVLLTVTRLPETSDFEVIDTLEDSPRAR
eukprot:NODE_7329_length_447_cov_114.012755.p3 GENE.NODE_7329_length_447_cov_114.012755~~NODE_7329_length_447_cov_114.012755.p3  ORF type:complete len:86 (+),score=26.07 NODE_7329_length_447_cov_114.012755:3-260(+)